MAKQLLTHSRMAAFKSCRRLHYYGYELGLRRIEDAKALRMGSAFHAALETLGKTGNVADMCIIARAKYADLPEGFDPYWWEIECETIVTLAYAYEWYWRSAKIETIAAEQAFQIPLVNPSTGAETPIFDLGGKIDGIVRLEDGRLAVKETKTTSDDLGIDSPLWRRLRIDHQISLYIHAARKLGFDVQTVLYDVVRKPTIKPTPVALTDENGMKIVCDERGERVKNKDGKTWRQTGDTAQGFVIQTRPMTVAEWVSKLNADIAERPDYYFRRQEIPRLNQDIDEYQNEIWDIQLTVRAAQRDGRHYRTVSKNTCEYCSYFDVCSTNQPIDPSSPPVGFEIVSDVHPELERNHDNHNSTPAHGVTAEATAATDLATVA